MGLLAGQTDPVALAALATTRLKASPAELAEALRGTVGPSHRFILKLHDQQVQHLEATLDAVDAEPRAQRRPFDDAVTLLNTIPGVSDTVAEVIVSEVGADMSRFPTPAHLLSWAGFCPRNDESDPAEVGGALRARRQHGAVEEQPRPAAEGDR